MSEEAAAQRADALRRLVGLGLLEVAEGAAPRIHRLIAAFASTAIAGYILGYIAQQKSPRLQ